MYYCSLQMDMWSLVSMIRGHCCPWYVVTTADSTPGQISLRINLRTLIFQRAGCASHFFLSLVEHCFSISTPLCYQFLILLKLGEIIPPSSCAPNCVQFLTFCYCRWAYSTIGSTVTWRLSSRRYTTLVCAALSIMAMLTWPATTLATSGLSRPSALR